MELTDLPECVLRERDPNLEFPTDIKTEAGRQALELWIIFSKNRYLDKFCETLRTVEFSKVEARGSIQIPTDKYYDVTYQDDFCSLPNRWRINIANYQLTGAWTQDFYVKNKITTRKRRGIKEDIKNQTGLYFRSPVKNKK